MTQLVADAEDVTSKVRNLRDYHYRVSNNLNPQPTGVDIASTLKFLSGRLLNILKDVPNIPAESYGPRQRDSVRLSVFPNMNYAGLYKAALSMIDLVPTIQSGNLELGESVLNVLGCLVPFLENDLLDSLPYTVASTLAIFPPTLHKDTIDLLCSNLLPMTLGFDGCSVPTYASESAAAIITMMCLNPSIQSREKPPPLYLCSDCAEILKKDHSDYMMEILLPMSHVATKCENKNCKTIRYNMAVSTCFSIECASQNGNRPIRYCATCNDECHGTGEGQDHVYHHSIGPIWSCTPEMQRYLMDAIIALLKEAQPLESKRMVEMGEEHRHRHGDDDDLFEVEEAGERKMLSRYGIWLLVELCTPREDIPIEMLGRLLGMLFQWFDATAYLPDGDCILSPATPSGICPSRGVLIWDYVIPKAFDIDMCSLPFMLDKMYHFVEVRFADPSAYVQEQALQWLQILSGLEIIIPLHTLFSMLKLGIKALQMIEPGEDEPICREPKSDLSRASPTGDVPPPLSPNKEEPQVVESFEIYERETEIILPCYIMMLDLVLKQVMQQFSPRDPCKIPNKEIPKELGSLKDTDALHSLLNSMKYLILHGECLNYSVNQYPDFLNLWIQLQAKSSHVALECVPLLLHCLTLPTGADMLWKIVEENFSMEKATVLARFMEPEQVMHNKTIKTGFAHIFCLLIGSLEDINAAVSQRTIQYLETVKATSIKCICQCLEFQFDAVISDRAMILHCTHLLSNILPDHSILSWEFFLARFDSLSLEAQIDLEATGDLAYPTDLTSSDRESEHFLRKLNRARFALARTDSIRSVSKSVYGKPPYRRAVSVPVHLLTKSPIKDKDKEKQCLRQQSAPQFRLNRQQTSKFNLGNLSNSVFQGGYLKEFTDEESNFAALLQRAMDLEGVDRETVHQLVALLMKFMVKCNQENLLEDVQKTESIVLRHLNVLLGYNQSEKSFSVPPYKLRTSAVFNSFLSGACFRYASDYQPPNYTLWYLEPHARTSWLQTLLVILYKYQINTSPISAIVQTLVRIVVNTIEAQHHHCKTLPDDAMPPSTPNLPRHKDSAKISVNDLENILETETPPQSPPAVTEDVFIEMVLEMEKGIRAEGMMEETPQLLWNMAKTKSERPISVEMKMVEQLEKFKKGEDKVTSPVREKAPPIRRVSAPRLDLTTPVSTYSKELTTSDISKTGQHSMSSRSTVTTADTTSMSLNQSEGTSKSPSQSEATNKSIIQSETSRDPLSEDVESAEESEKTQTTSDAESVGDPTKDKAKGGKKTSPRSKPGIKPNFRQRKSRKTGLTTIELQKKFPELAAEGMDTEKTTKSGRRMRKTDLLTKPVKKPMPNRHSENAMVERCGDCNAILEQYDDETIGMCVVVLATYIHREPSLATPMLLESLIAVSRIASSSPYTWQMETNVIIPGNSLSISRQFIRCCLHQLAPNGIFPMLFQSSFEDNQFLKSIAAALTDFSELPCHAAIHHLLEGLNNTRNLTAESIQVLLDNLATYMNSIVLESSAAMWTNILNQFDVFFRRLTEILPVPCDMTSHILEPFSKLVSIAVTTCTIQLNQVLDICSLGNRVFSRERDKLYLTRTVIFQLVQALKFKASLPDDNLLLMVQFVVLDAGGTIGSTNIVGDLGMLYHTHAHSLMSTYAAECMRQYLSDCVEFISDLHTISKLKTNMKGGCTALNEDTLGSLVKSGMAQFVALEITRGNGRDNRAIARYLPWLYHPPSTTQQGPKEFTDCIGHIRLMSWLLIGTLTHTAMTEGAACITCMPFPLDSSTFIAEHVLVILTGFAEQSNLAELVNLHFLSLMEALQECNSSLFPMWTSILYAYHQQLPGHLQVRLQTVQNWQPPAPSSEQTCINSNILLTWLKRIQFRLGQIEYLLLSNAQENLSSIANDLFCQYCFAVLQIYTGVLQIVRYTDFNFLKGIYIYPEIKEKDSLEFYCEINLYH
ncbi:UNC79-like protein [Mya arenaria]|uniref:UNC79-like protein n=1 Tax=Mya arenaria TaxID=6604 RepID=A0ABY7FFF0_MYAAR|nr:UNC79-like protein [Mya arenaria]